MPQSAQDDAYEDLATFAETTFIFLQLVAKQRRLNTDEIYILERATKATAALHDEWTFPISYGHRKSLAAPASAGVPIGL